MNAVTEAWPAAGTGAGDAAAAGNAAASAHAGTCAPAQVTIAREADERDWQAWIEGFPQATIFHDWAWRGLLASAFGHRPHYLLARRAGRVVGVLPLAQVKTWLFGHALVSLPFCPYAGPLGEDREVLDALDRNADALARKLGVEHLEYRSLGESHRGWPTQDLYVVFRKPIGADHDANMNAIPRKQRAMVRKGIKAQLTSAPGDLDTFFTLFSDNVHRHGTPTHSRRFFALMLEAFGERADILVVHNPQGAPVSGVLSLYFRDEVLPLHAGDHPQARELAANDFKYWELMRRSADRGCRVFNYGRSKRGTGPFDFKKNWGFEPTPLTYEYRLYRRDSVPQNNPLNPKYRLMIATWRRLPRWLVNAIGPYLVRGLG